MELKDSIFTVMDIDELSVARERMGVRDCDNSFLWHGTDTNMSLVNHQFGRKVFSSEPGTGGRFWDNPGKINKIVPPGIVMKKKQKRGSESPSCLLCIQNEISLEDVF